MRRTSVGRRLSVLVLAESLTALALVVVTSYAIHGLTLHSRYTHRFILIPIVEIGVALERAAKLEIAVQERVPTARAESSLAEIERFAAKYRSDILVAGSSSPDALRQIEELRHAHELRLIEKEKQALDALDLALRNTSMDLRTPEMRVPRMVDDAHAVREALSILLAVNVRFAAVTEAASERLAALTRWIVGAVGLAGFLAALGLGLNVRQAIAPRVEHLVVKVRRFQECGVIERIADPGCDELGTLAGALDIGFSSIATRSRDRERFFAVAAHELKTPISNILGFAHAALASPERAEVRQRSLQIIERQAHRMGRLVEDLFLSARARTSDLPFAPTPLALRPLVEKVAAEVESQQPDHRFEVESGSPIQVIADEFLLGHALWTLLTVSSKYTTQGALIRVTLSRREGRAVLVLRASGPVLDPEQLELLFEPFMIPQYEDVGGDRHALHLFLCREIARTHGGNLQVSSDLDGVVFTFEITG